MEEYFLEEFNNEERWCVYIHTNKINNKAYIGITKRNPEDRWGSNGCRYNIDGQPAFAGAIKKYGWDNFEHIIFINNIDEDKAKYIERLLISLYKTNCTRWNNPSYGYNMTDGGDGSAGRAWSDESKEKLSKSLIGHPTSEETKRKISKANTGRTYSPEALRRMSESHIGIQAGENHPRYGKHISEETREKLRRSRTGKKTSEETKKKQSESQKKRLEKPENHPNYGKHLSEEHRRHIGESNKGKTISDETKKAISEAQSVSVVQLSKNGEFIMQYSSMLKAQEATGIDRRQIGKCCRHEKGRKTAGGFKWMYAEEYYKMKFND